jgi:glycosyltransferase involved in cell wall biosynthesis
MGPHARSANVFFMPQHTPHSLPLSVIVIALNEAANITACLRSVAFASEVIVVDGGSADDTQALARQAGAIVHVHADWQGFGVQKRRALAYASGPWVLSLDADERVTPELASEIAQALVQVGDARVAFEIPRLTQFCGHWVRHCGWTPDHVLRLFRRDQANFSADQVHEKVELKPGVDVRRLKSALQHYSYPSVAHYWRKLDAYSQAWAAQRFAQGRRAGVGRAVVSGVFAFVRSYLLRLGFLDGRVGLAVSVLQAQAAFGKYFSLYCMQLQKGSSDGRNA